MPPRVDGAMLDPFDLDRFVAAQDGVHADALAELRRGRKTTHWMWFVFPQIAGLGRSPTAQHFAIRSAAKARAYLAHPLLGARLHEAVTAIMAAPGSAVAILGDVDAAKLRSSLTLFAAVADDPAHFETALARFFDGADEATLQLLDPKP